MEKYLRRRRNLTMKKSRRLSVKATIANEMVPVLCGSSYKNKGVQNMLDAIVDYMPSPLDIPPD